jgi:2-dehydro-3-deoxyphosphooctonate aldolase (KDO 8-P synthase)
MTLAVNAGGVTVGGGTPLVLIAGPCVIESRDLCYNIAIKVKSICSELGIPYIFKASFDKANRLSASSGRGPGLEEGLGILKSIRDDVGVPVLTDVHEVWQVEPAASAVDILQIPAFLCRQTDLVVAAARTGKPVNIKKGQFLAPSDMKSIADKAVSAGNDRILLTERGASFGYGNLVADMRSLPVMRSFGFPVVFDATHSVQRPGGLGESSGGDPQFIRPLVRAACAVGIDALFLEVHPNPSNAVSDAATMLSLEELRRVLEVAKAVDAAVRGRI